MGISADLVLAPIKIGGDTLKSRFRLKNCQTQFVNCLRHGPKKRELRDPAHSRRSVVSPCARAVLGLDPALPSTWIEHAAWLDSACPQLDGEHIVTWPPSTD